MKYLIKFEDQTYLTKPDRHLIGNFLSSEMYSQFDRTTAYSFENKLDAEKVSSVVGGTIVTLETTERFEEGKTYLTIKGEEATILECFNNTVGYETVKVQLPSGKIGGRYNRSTGGWDNGRTTGSKWTEDCLRYPPEEVEKEPNLYDMKEHNLACKANFNIKVYDQGGFISTDYVKGFQEVLEVLGIYKTSLTTNEMFRIFIDNKASKHSIIYLDDIGELDCHIKIEKV